MGLLYHFPSYAFFLGGGQRPKGAGRHHPLSTLGKPWPQNGIIVGERSRGCGRRPASYLSKSLLSSFYERLPLLQNLKEK